MNESTINEMSEESLLEIQCFDRPIYNTSSIVGFARSDDSSLSDLRKLNKSLKLIKIKTIAYRDRRDIRKSLAQFYGILHAMFVRFVYIIRGNPNGVDFYVGISSEDGAGNVQDMTWNDLTHSLLGVMPGCRIEPLTDKTRVNELVTDVMTGYEHSYIVTGVPTCQVAMEKRDQYQEEEKARTGIERLIDSVSGEDFVLSVLCEPMHSEELSEYRKAVAGLIDGIKPYAKYQFTGGISGTRGGSSAETETKGVSTSEGTTSTEGTSTPEKQGSFIKRRLKSAKVFWKGGSSVNITRSQQKGTSKTQTESSSRGTTVTESVSETKSLGISRERTNMELSALCMQLEKLHKRLLDAGGEGMWKTCIMFHAHDEIVLKRAAFTATAIWQGADSAIDPIRCLHIEKSGNAVATQPWLMELNFTGESDSGPFHIFGKAYSNLYTCLTHKELAHIADFPHWDMPGVTVLPLVEYARVSPQVREGDSIELGGLIDRSTVNYDEYERKVKISHSQLNKHCFVSGITGSGKSTTMRKLLREIASSGDGHHAIPFMVIEPVKREYRELQNTSGLEVEVFSLGRRGCNFALNPFSFGEGTPLFSHLDFLKSSFNALLGSYSSMPFILETILCKCYENSGWNLGSGENPNLERERSRLSSGNRVAQRMVREKYMPIIKDMANLVDGVLNDYFGEDKSDYRISLRGALKARLNSLTSSLKGKVLGRQEEEPFEELLKKNVVFELEAFSDNEEKSFIMALLLGRVYEIRQAEAQQSGGEGHGLRHVVVLEEAHRLLSKIEGKGEFQANPRANAVEVFSDMLAEVRSYGQGLIIVDQIPSKLTPEVMKNTEVKIVHRLLSKDDREAVGATMNLTKEQIEDLARHNPGEATMYFGDLTNALHVKIEQ